MSALASRIFEKSGKGAAPGASPLPAASKGADMNPEAVAGKRFAEAVKGGDGATVAAAYRDLKQACADGDDGLSAEAEDDAY